MTVENYLSQYGTLKSWLSSDQVSLKVLRSSMADIHAPDIASDSVQVSPSAEASYVAIMEKQESLEDKIRFEEDLLLRLKAEILRMMDPLDSDEYELLMLRYIRGLKWDLIFSHLHACRAAVFRWHQNLMKRLTLPENAIDIREEIKRHKPG